MYLLVYSSHTHTHTHSLSIELSSPQQHTVSSLSLRYNVPWPLDIVFSEPIMATYNQIFQLLLHVRWAKWSLEEIRTRGLCHATKLAGMCVPCVIPSSPFFLLSLRVVESFQRAVQKVTSASSAES